MLSPSYPLFCFRDLFIHNKSVGCSEVLAADDLGESCTPVLGIPSLAASSA